mmetsp:Transcript_28888/g.56710  ORF Transcript_28888/g.56710 Transcript_28888/m.56710 type:complete len:214 (+) Transcript_28888:31-672(+)|eukprot:CAMPEP_0175131602 /NCGR_PEP_ID=MMETSP0087-20121206/6633_1 /TAXON_ID=136419 /ORGANISM="Unknown Unknown, Strain D1" /LENGTH=213 /DNA_ID=CAMNT_0016413909 /DNA_START=33 /DNA_END=674 /DNA_ORIENTATION=-
MVPPKFIHISLIFCCTLILVLAMAAGDGGCWSTATTESKGTGLSLPVTFKFGLTQYAVVVGSLKQTNSYASQLTSSSDPAIKMDFDDIISGGHWTGACLAIATILLAMGLGVHVCIYPFNVAERVHKYGFPLVLASGFFFMLAVVFWAALGHAAAEHIAVNRYPEIVPSLSYGWGFDTGVVCCLFILAAVVLSLRATKLGQAQTPADYTTPDL